MSKPVRRLGRGLDSLVSNVSRDESVPTDPDAVETSREVRAREGSTGQTDSVEGSAVLAVDSLEPNPLQPRSDTDRASLLSLGTVLLYPKVR